MEILFRSDRENQDSSTNVNPAYMNALHPGRVSSIRLWNQVRRRFGEPLKEP